jgi:hypothetical protein
LWEFDSRLVKPGLDLRVKKHLYYPMSEKSHSTAEMVKTWCVIIVLQFGWIVSFSQTNPTDSLLTKTDTIPPIDTTIDYDLLFDEMESFLDSISAPRSYTLAALVFGKKYFYYKTKESRDLKTTGKIVFTPTAGYYHKSGFGITGVASFVNDQKNFSFYQLAITPSYDYLANRNLATGFSYTRYATKDSLPFYTSPLQNELYAYFTYRKWWFKPMVAVSYGWGSRSEYRERETYLTDYQLATLGFARVNTSESISDLSVVTSVRHDFYWLDVLNFRDHIRLTPQLSFTSGSQKFGFNQSSNTYVTRAGSNTATLYSTENVYFDNKMYFQPISLTFHLRTEYAIGKFYIQPQIVLDYYFPADDNRFSKLFTFNAGIMF